MDAAPGPEALRRRLARLKSIPTLPKMLERVVGGARGPEVELRAGRRA